MDVHRRTRPTISIDQYDAQELSRSSRLVSRSIGPEDHVLLQDDAARVQRWLDHLPERQRAIVELRLAGLSGDEIARTLHMSESAVKSAQFRAYATLRSIIPGDQR